MSGPILTRGGVRGCGSGPVGAPPRPADSATSARPYPEAPAGRAESTQMGGAAPASTGDPLVTFLYLLMRDHVVPGVIEERTLEIEGGAAAGEWRLTNAFLAAYAENVAERLCRSFEVAADAGGHHLVAAEAHIEALLRSPRVSETDRTTDETAALRFLDEMAHRRAVPLVKKVLAEHDEIERAG